MTLSSYPGRSEIDRETDGAGFMISGSNVNSQSSDPPQLSRGRLTHQKYDNDSERGGNILVVFNLPSLLSSSTN